MVVVVFVVLAVLLERCARCPLQYYQQQENLLLQDSQVPILVQLVVLLLASVNQWLDILVVCSLLVGSCQPVMMIGMASTMVEDEDGH